MSFVPEDFSLPLLPISVPCWGHRNISNLKISTAHFHFTELQHWQTANISSFLENYQVALLSEATSAFTTTDDDPTIPHLSASPQPIDLLANEVVMEHYMPDHNPRHSSFNFDGGSTEKSAEVNDALQNLSVCIDQVINSNDNKPAEKKSARSRYQSTRKEIHVRSMLWHLLLGRKVVYMYLIIFHPMTPFSFSCRVVISIVWFP